MKLKLFTIAVLLHPVKPQDEDTKIIVEPINILAIDEDVAEKKAIRMVSPDYDDRLGQLEVLVRPF